jgi:hypothetical protein
MKQDIKGRLEASTLPFMILCACKLIQDVAKWTTMNHLLARPTARYISHAS